MNQTLTRMKSAPAAALIFGAIAFMGPATSQAEGFLGGIINKVVPGLGVVLDDMNDSMGNPVDHAAAVVANAYVPGSGAVMEAGWAVQRSGAFQQQVPVPQPMYNSMPGPVGQNPYTPIAMAEPHYYQSMPQHNPRVSQACGFNEVFMATPGGACCTPDYSFCRNLTTGGVTRQPMYR